MDGGVGDMIEASLRLLHLVAGLQLPKLDALRLRAYDRSAQEFRSESRSYRMKLRSRHRKQLRSKAP